MVENERADIKENKNSSVGLYISLFAALLSMVNTYIMWKQIDQQSHARFDAYGSGYYESKINAFSEFSNAGSHLYTIILSFYEIGFKKGKIPGKYVSQMYSVIQKYSGEYVSAHEKARFFMDSELEKKVLDYTSIQANALNCTNNLVQNIDIDCDTDKFFEFISDDGKRLDSIRKLLQADASPNKAAHTN